MTNVDVALVVALDEEYQTIRRTLGISPKESAERVHIFEVQGAGKSDRTLKMVIHVTGEMGLVPTANATNMVLDKFSPEWLVSIGLAGQLNSDCALGDVVLANACDLAYSESRLSVDGSEFAGSSFEVAGLRGFLKTVDLSKYLQGRELHIPPAGRKDLEERRLWRRFPLVHAGIVCSTDFVVDDPKKKLELLTRNRRFLCTDMESAAMVSAARKREYSGNIVIIRAVSDPADGTKKAIDKLAGSGVFRQYAMRNATTLLQHAVLASNARAQDGKRHADRPLVAEAVSRLQRVSVLLSSSANRAEAVADIDADSQWTARDSDLAKYVYRARISRSTTEVPRPLAREVAALAADPAINFYVALHVMRSLYADFETMPEFLTPLTHVHTYEVNQYCKALLESAKKQSKLSKLLERINAAYDAANKSELEPAARSNLQAHLCYLMGRVSDEQSRRRAKETLERWRDRLIASAPDKKKSSAGRRQLGISVTALERFAKEQLLQYRTIQISLVQLEGPEESDRYILSCIASARLDAQNRGFHLEYYGDTPYDPAQPLSNEDGLGAIPKTLDTLGQKLLRAFSSGGKYPLRDIELYTVIALLRSRLQQGVLHESDRARGLQVLSTASWMSTNEKLRMLLDRITSDLKNPNFHPSGVVEEIFKLKKLRRTGWTARGRKVVDPESVGSHTFGGLVLIELFLPETKSPESRPFGPPYSKEKVLRLFVKHDWAEAIIGDLLPDEKTEEAGAREDAAFRTLGLVSIYSPYANRTVYEDWLAFEKGTSINCQLARDVDQLDCLQQLLIESHSNPSSIPDRSSWIEYIENRVRTDWGRQMFGFLLKRD